MYGLEAMLVDEEERLERIMSICREGLAAAPEGSLRVFKKGEDSMQCYLVLPGEKNGRYLRKEQADLAQSLAQKMYLKKVLPIAEQEYKLIEKLHAFYADDLISSIYEAEPEPRQTLIRPVEKSWEERVMEWESTCYETKPFQEESPVILTERGERVRSKSEKLLADYFLHHGIPYKYEKPLYLRGYGTVYPDFTLLSKKLQREVYWEHDGKMDDPTYARAAVKKIRTYEKNGFLLGRDVIFTFETEATVLNTGDIEMLFHEYFGEE